MKPIFKDKKNKKRAVNIVIGLTTLFIVGGMGYDYYIDKTTETIPYTEFLDLIEESKIESVKGDLINDTVITVTTTDEKIFKTDNPKSKDFKLEMLQLGIGVEEVDSEALMRNFVSLISIASTIGILIFISFSLTGGLKFNQATPEIAKTKFKDIAGMDEVKEDVKLIVEFLKDPKKFENKGAKLPKGIVLYGEPGTGKTLMARAVSSEANVPFFHISGSDFIELFAGLGAKRVRNLFKDARKKAPCIIFIDEIDAIGSKRTGDVGNGELRQTINALLAEMDGFSISDGVLVMCATNRIEDLDPALIRPGRFDKHIKVPIPQTPEERLSIIELYKEGKTFSEDLDFELLARETIGFSPADIEVLMNEAVLISIQLGKEQIDRECFDQAFYKKVMKGHAKKDTKRDKEENELIAWHEAGHCVVAKLHDMDVNKVSILSSTNGAGGVNLITPKKIGLYSQEELISQVRLCYGGRAAELLFTQDTNKITTGASNDIKNATSLIYQMITQYGMSEKYGLVNLEELKVENNIIFEEVIEMANRIEKETFTLLQENIELLKAIKDELLLKETISAHDINKIFSKFY